MTPPATGTALLILVAFVLPGFVAVLLKERIYEVRGEESTFDRLLTTVYYSLLVYMLPALAVCVLSALNALDRVDLQNFFTGRAPLWLTGLVAVAVLLLLPAAAATPGTAPRPRTCFWRNVGTSARMEPDSKDRPPAMSAFTCPPTKSSPSSSTLSAMPNVTSSPNGRPADTQRPTTPPGTGERGRQPAVAHPKPTGPVPIGKPIHRSK